MTIRRVCVFCGSSPGIERAFQDAAEALGRALVSRGMGLVYGGASVGLMGRIADTMLAEGGDVTGVMPAALVEREVAHENLSDLRVVGSMHERKALMMDLSDAFVALPGGLGTFEELLESLTWAQLGLHRKPCGILNVGGFFDHLTAFLDEATSRGFIDPSHRSLLIESDRPTRLLHLLASETPHSADKGRWIHYMNRHHGDMP